MKTTELEREHPEERRDSDRILAGAESIVRERGKLLGTYRQTLFRLIHRALLGNPALQRELLPKILEIGLASDASRFFKRLLVGTPWFELTKRATASRIGSSETSRPKRVRYRRTEGTWHAREPIRVELPEGSKLQAGHETLEAIPVSKKDVRQRATRSPRKKNGGGGRGSQKIGVRSAPKKGGRSGDRRRGIRKPARTHKSSAIRKPVSSAPRVVNLRFKSNGARDVKQDRPLRAGHRYQLHIDVGPRSPKSVVRNPSNVRANLLPESAGGHWLKVAVVSEKFKVAQPASWLFLPTAGPSWCCKCTPDGPHKCRPAARKKSLVVVAKAPHKEGPADLRVVLYYKTTVVQSLHVTADIAGNTRARGSHRAVVDYNLTNRFTDLSYVGPRAMSIMMNDSEDGTHRLIFNGAPKKPVTLILSEDQLTTALAVMRTVMRAIHIEEVGKSRTNRFDKNNAKKLQDFIKDLRTAAVEGARLWHSLWEDRIDEWLDNEAMFVAGSQTIQVARKHKSTHIFPWAMVYDLPIDVGTPAKNSLCTLLSEAQWKQFQFSDGFPRRCPFEATHKPGVICPYGFWGFRYAVEQPPSRPKTYVAKPIRAEPKPIKAIAALSQDLDGKLLQSHLDVLKSHAGFNITECRTRDTIEDGLGVVDLMLVYFYCHGLTLELPGKAGVVPRLGVGKEEIIEPPDLSKWLRTEWPRNHWKDVAPLVFINGCHTTDSSPQTLVNFVDTFAGSLGAAGVIGTEITLDQLVANEAGQVFMDAFKQATSVGESLHRVRVHLLKKGNLLGLVYTSHCSAGLSLSASVA